MKRRDFLGVMASAGPFLLRGSGLRDVVSNVHIEKAWPEIKESSEPDWDKVRSDFPRAARKLWLAAAETHPFSIHTLKAIENYSYYRMLGPGNERKSFTPEMQAELKMLFANLINAKPEEIAFVMSTTDGENIVVEGIDLLHRGGNVVIDDLHFPASKYMYSMLQKKGFIELRIVRHRDWRIKIEDMERAIDRNTRLVSLALVSNVNGYMHEAKAISEIAHERGALVYGDIIQAAGCTPVDVKEMGIDCCACSTYKWLMGDFGIGFLYVREDLQGTVIKQTRYGLRQLKSMKGFEFELLPGAALYEGTTSIPYLPGICAYEGLKYVTKLGVENIRKHAKRLTDRLQKEMPLLGYLSITPPESPTPIVSFLTPDPEGTNEKLDRAFGEHVVTLTNWEKTNEKGETEMVSGIRVSVSVYNNDEDIDQFLEALR